MRQATNPHEPTRLRPLLPSVRTTRLRGECRMGAIETRLEDLAITLPRAAAPVANYVPFVQDGRLVHDFGAAVPRLRRQARARTYRQGRRRGEPGHGQGRCAALRDQRDRSAQGGGGRPGQGEALRPAGRLHRQRAGFHGPGRRHERRLGPVSSRCFGDKGRHARSTIGVAALPLGASVEVEALFAVE